MKLNKFFSIRLLCFLLLLPHITGCKSDDTAQEPFQQEKLVHRHGWTVIIMKRTHTYIITSLPLQSHITVDHIHNIASGSYFLHQLL